MFVSRKKTFVSLISLLSLAVCFYVIGKLQDDDFDIANTGYGALASWKGKVYGDKTANATDNYVRYIPPRIIDHLAEASREYTVEKNKFAYVQYSTNRDYTCNALMNFARLRNFEVDADLVLLTDQKTIDVFPERFHLQIEYLNITLKVIEKLHFEGAEKTWEDSFTKFHVFNVNEYDKVIYFDSDSTVLANMDQLFFIPDADLAIPLAYGTTLHNMKKRVADKELLPSCEVQSAAAKEEYERGIIKKSQPHKSSITFEEYSSMVYKNLPHLPDDEYRDDYYLSDTFMVLKPSQHLFEYLVELCKNKKENEYDMDLINNEFSIRRGQDSSAYSKSNNPIPKLLILPHEVYGPLSGIFRSRDYDVLELEPHEFECYASAMETKRNDAVDEMEQVLLDEEHTESVWGKMKCIHFSDWPIPKPWIRHDSTQEYTKHKIECAAKQEVHIDARRLFRRFSPQLVSDCAASGYWNGLYDDFKTERRRVCGLNPR